MTDIDFLFKTTLKEVAKIAKINAFEDVKSIMFSCIYFLCQGGTKFVLIFNVNNKSNFILLSKHFSQRKQQQRHHFILIIIAQYQ